MIIISDNINSSSNSLKDYIEQITNEIKSIKAKVDTIPEFWTGENATKFIDKFNNEYNPIMNRYMNVLLEYYKFLSQVLPVFEALEEDYNYNINIE